MTIIDRIKNKMKILDKEKEKRDLLYKKNKIYGFYEKSLSIAKVNNGMVYLITPDEVLQREATNEQSHKRICELLLSEKYKKDIIFDSTSDFGKKIARDYKTIFIRMVSIVNNVSVLYYPDEVNEYQLEEFKKFKALLDEYNENHKDYEKAEIIYTDENGEESNDLDALIERLEKKVKMI